MSSPAGVSTTAPAAGGGGELFGQRDGGVVRLGGRRQPARGGQHARRWPRRAGTSARAWSRTRPGQPAGGHGDGEEHREGEHVGRVADVEGEPRLQEEEVVDAGADAAAAVTAGQRPKARPETSTLSRKTIARFAL